MHRTAGRLIAPGVPAGRALRRHWRSATAMGVSVVVGLSASLAVGPTEALRFASVRDAGWPLRGSALAAAPADTQAQAVAALAGLVRGIATAALCAACVTIMVTAVARAQARRVDIHIRRAVGASRRVLTASAVLEGGAIAVAGLTLGVVGGGAIQRGLVASWPGSHAGPPTGGTAAIVVIGALVIVGGLLPLAHARQRATPPAVGDDPLWLPVPAVQFAIGLVALVLAAQLAQGATALTRPPLPGTGGGTVMTVTPQAASAEGRAEAYGAVLAAHHGRGPVASLTSPGMLLGLGRVDIAVTDCGQCQQGGIVVQHRAVPVVHHLVSADTFRAIGLPLIAGRGITDADTWRTPRVAVVSRRLAQDHFQHGEAVGRLIRVGRGTDGWYTVVGIVADRDPDGFGGRSQPRRAVYLSVLQHPPGTADLLVSGPADPPVDRAGRADVVVGRPTALAALRRAEAAPARWFARVVRIEGWLAFAAAVFGMVVAMRLWAIGLLPELALRRAVGARRARVLGYVAARAAGVVVAGVALGAWMGPVVSDVAQRAVAGLPPWDLRLAPGPLGVLTVVTLLAALAPVWRSAAGPPASSLEHGRS